MSSCTGTQKKETLTNCVITPCMVMKTKGIPLCTGTPGQPRKLESGFFERSEYSQSERGKTVSKLGDEVQWVSFRVEDLKLTGFLSLAGVSLPFQQ